MKLIVAGSRYYDDRDRIFLELDTIYSRSMCCDYDMEFEIVMVDVDLNTVRESLGHADIKMTLRYAHLAPEHKAKVVAKLVEAA